MQTSKTSKILELNHDPFNKALKAGKMITQKQVSNYTLKYPDKRELINELVDSLPEYFEQRNLLIDSSDQGSLDTTLIKGKLKPYDQGILDLMKDQNSEQFQQFIKAVTEKNDTYAKNVFAQWKTIARVNKILKDSYARGLLKKYFQRLGKQVVYKS